MAISVALDLGVRGFQHVDIPIVHPDGCEDRRGLRVLERRDLSPYKGGDDLGRCRDAQHRR
jgi:hypothetical protein